MRGTLVFLIFLTVVTIKAESESEEGIVLGIDLGSTYSCVGVFKDGQVQIIPDGQDNPKEPSDERHWQMRPSLLKLMRLIKSNELDKLETQEQRNKASTEVLTMIYQMKKTAEIALKQKVKGAVIAVPSYFDDGQRKFIVDVGEIAGLKVTLIDEPKAAGLAYGLEKREGVKHVLVFDLGGTTFDVSMLEVVNGDLEIIATNKDDLGGEDFNQRVLDHFIEIYDKKNLNLLKDEKTIRQIRAMIERTKKAISKADKLTIKYKNMFDGPVKDFSETLTKVKFQELNEDLFSYTLKSVLKVLDQSNIPRKEIDAIVLVGGSTRIPKIQELLKEFFHGKKELLMSIEPEEVIAYGAAIHAGTLPKEDNENLIDDKNNTKDEL